MSKSIFDKKLSPILSDLLPEFVRADHQQFIKFLRDYFKYLEAGELEISGSVNYLKQETLSENFVLDEMAIILFYKIQYQSLQLVKLLLGQPLKQLHKFL